MGNKGIKFEINIKKYLFFFIHFYGEYYEKNIYKKNKTGFLRITQM